jgi:hypothetical protein
LGLSEAEFLNLTPQLLEALSERKMQKDRMELRNAALVATTIINVNRAKGKKAIRIEDIIGKDDGLDNEEGNEAELLELLKIIDGRNKAN